MKNKIVGSNRPAFFGQGNKMHSGLVTHGVSLGLDVAPEFKLCLDAGTGGEDGFQGARLLKGFAFAEKHQQGLLAAQFIGRARGVLTSKLGKRWSLAWVEAGFKNNSLAVPVSLDGKGETLRCLHTYFTAHPTHAVAQLVITAAEAEARRLALESAVNGVNNCKSDTGTKKTTRAGAEKTLRQRMQLLVSELTFRMGPLDDRWPAFGLNKPGETERPALVTNLVLSSLAPKSLSALWDPAARAVRYLVQVLVVGVDTDFRTVAELFEEHVDLNSFVTGQVVQVRVIAVNGAGQSLPSAVAEQVIA